MTGRSGYRPANADAAYSAFYDRIYRLVALVPAGKVATYGQLAALAGNPRAGNVIIMGAFSTCPGLPLQPEQLLRSFLQLVPEKYKDINAHAFEIGRRAMEAS